MSSRARPSAALLLMLLASLVLMALGGWAAWMEVHNRWHDSAHKRTASSAAYRCAKRYGQVGTGPTFDRGALGRQKRASSRKR